MLDTANNICYIIYIAIKTINNFHTLWDILNHKPIFKEE